MNLIDFCIQFDYPELLFWLYDVSTKYRTLAKSKLKEIISSPDFWGFYRDNRPKNLIKIKNYENLPLIRRVVASGFSKIASYEEKNLLRKLLEHNYSWISNLAIHPYIEISDKNDLNNLIKYVLTNIDKLEEDKISNLIKTICTLDQKLYEGLG